MLLVAEDVAVLYLDIPLLAHRFRCQLPMRILQHQHAVREWCPEHEYVQREFGG